MPWIVFLAVTMQADDYMAARWGLAWVGLDIAEVVGLVGAALLVRRRDVRASPVAAATGTLFLVDAWFDTVTSHTSVEQVQALSLAVLAELPLTVFCMATAWRSVRWLTSAPSNAMQPTDLKDRIRGSGTPPQSEAPDAA